MTKPFDYAAAKAGAPVQTRDGRKARIVCWDRAADSPIVTLIEQDNGVPEYITAHDIDGKWCATTPKDRSYDLVMAPRKRTVWVNAYDNEPGYAYWTLDEANIFASDRRIGGKAWPLDIEE